MKKQSYNWLTSATINWRYSIRGFVSLMFAISLFSTIASTQATPVNPNPALFGADTGQEIFNVGRGALFLELFDLGEVFNSGEFGFFFASNPSELITLFSPEDLSNLATLPLTSQVASVNFEIGVIADLDDPGTFEPSFTPGSGPLGFYFRLTNSDPILYTLASLNPSGRDLAGAFPLLSDPDAVSIAFESPDNGALLSLHTFVGISVSEPDVVTMLMAGLMLMWFARRSDRTGARRRLFATEATVS